MSEPTQGELARSLDETKDRQRIFERHLQTALTGALCVLAGFVGTQVSQVSAKVTTMASDLSSVMARLNALDRSVNDMNLRFDRYQLRTEADLQFNTLRDAATQNRARIERLEAEGRRR